MVVHSVILIATYAVIICLCIQSGRRIYAAVALRKPRPLKSFKSSDATACSYGEFDPNKRNSVEEVDLTQCCPEQQGFPMRGSVLVASEIESGIRISIEDIAAELNRNCLIEQANYKDGLHWVALMKMLRYLLAFMFVWTPCCIGFLAMYFGATGLWIMYLQSLPLVVSGTVTSAIYWQNYTQRNRAAQAAPKMRF